MLPEWMYDAPNPGLALLGLGLVLLIVMVFNMMQGSPGSAIVMLIASALSIGWGAYTTALHQKTRIVATGLPMDVRTGNQHVLYASIASLAVLIILVVAIRYSERLFQTVFLSTAALAFGACLAYEFQLWMYGDSRLSLAVSVLEMASAVQLLLGLTFAQVQLFTDLREARSQYRQVVEPCNWRQHLSRDAQNGQST